MDNPIQEEEEAPVAAQSPINETTTQEEPENELTENLDNYPSDALINEGLEQTEIENSQLDDTNLMSEVGNPDEKLEEYGVKIDDNNEANEPTETTEMHDMADTTDANVTNTNQSVEESGVTDDSDLDKEELKKMVQQTEKKEIKRKSRPPKKIVDGNLIPEEDSDNEGMLKIRSPGPPPLEPISQRLDDEKYDFSLGHKHDGDLLGQQSPDKMDVTLDEDYQEIQVEAKPTREELIAKYQQLVEEKEKLQTSNNQLHNKLADYFRRKKPDDTLSQQQLFEKNSPEQEQRYQKYLATIEDLRKKLESERQVAEEEIDEIKNRCDIKQGEVNEERLRYTKMKKESASKSYTMQSGKPPAPKLIDAFLQREQLKELEVISVRLENIKLTNHLKKKELELKAKEELGEGLHMIDFEQLKIENQTYNEKIEERNEELMKLKRKINNNVQTLTHIKEKLQFVVSENEKENESLRALDEEVKEKRDILNKTKQSRDSLRMDNAKLRQNSGLLGNTVLLRDFENCVDKNEELKSNIEALKQRHAELILNTKIIKQKISEARSDKLV